jgi:hypothetical protein
MEYPQDLRTALDHWPDGMNATWTTSLASCRCPKSGRKVKQRSRWTWLLKYHSFSKGRHLSDCPLYSESDLETTTFLTLSAHPFLTGTVELLASFYAARQRLTCFTVKYSPTVRRTDSPSFTLFQNVLAEWKLQAASFEPDNRGLRSIWHDHPHPLPSFNGLDARLQDLPAKLHPIPVIMRHCRMKRMNSETPCSL